MDKRLLLFMLIMFGALSLNALIATWLNPRQPKPADPAAVAENGDPAGENAQPQDGQDAQQPEVGAPNADLPGDAIAEEPDQNNKAQQKPVEAPQDGDRPETAPVAHPETWLTLGSLDKTSPYRMLVVVSSAGAVVEEAVLQDEFRDLELDDPLGYLGPLAETDDPGGARVRVVGPGTPAEKAGLLPGDVITAIDGGLVDSAAGLSRALDQTREGKICTISVLRAGAVQQLQATLAPRPLRILTREVNEAAGVDQGSLLLTLSALDDTTLRRDAEELEGMKLRTAHWELTNSSDSLAEFTMSAGPSLKLVKRIRLALDNAETKDRKTENFHLDVDIEIVNQDAKAHRVGYRLDGPTGLPTEGWWYAGKVNSGGVRDVIRRYHGEKPVVEDCSYIASEKFLEEMTLHDQPVEYIGVDAQYFAAVLLPLKNDPAESWHAHSGPYRAGPVPTKKGYQKLLNTSVRLISRPRELAAGESLTHTYRLFLGPKEETLLSHYKLDGLLDYGWFHWVAVVLQKILHTVAAVVKNYAIAIVLLTCIVRGCMLPISIKQSKSAQKMQELQPEMKRINEKYKTNMEQRNKELQALFRKHNHNPLGGCLLVFAQLPIFIGLYRSLMVDVNMRQAPLASFIPWCTNLSAPDKLFRWDSVLPGFLADYTGWLGPYCNVLPLVTVGLYLWQQKMFMPPATDEQTAMQQKMMTWMTVFMGFMFYKVAGGLCIYFIASSIWSICERKWIARKLKPPSAGESKPAAQPKRNPSDGNGNGKTEGGRSKTQKS